MELHLEEVNKSDIMYNNIIKNFYDLCSFVPKYYPFPGGLPVSILKNNFKVIVENGYTVCDKSDGTRYMLFLTKELSSNIGYFINRSMNIYKIKINLGYINHIGTIYDGELVKKKNGSWVFLIFDIFATKGHKMSEVKSHQTRLKSAIENNYMKQIKEPFFIKVKEFHDISNIHDFIKNKYNNMEYDTDGLIFTPKNRKIFNGTDKGTFKWKKPELNTIDFQIIKDNKSYKLLLWEFEKKIEIQKLTIKNEQLKTEIDALLQSTIVIVECEWIKQSNNIEWIPISIRKDKSHPNSYKTYNSTLDTINDNISINDIMNMKK